MPRTLTHTLMAATLSTTALLLAPAGLAQAPADLAPADTPVYIHITDPAAWFVDLTQGPVGQKMREKIQTQAGTGDLLAAMGMTLDQFMDTYFGGEVVVLSPGEDKDGVIFTQVNRASRERAIDSLGLKRNGEIAGYPAYTGDDGNGVIVLTDDWVALAELDAVDYLTTILELGEDAPRLADTERYARWTRELPAGRSLTALLYENDEADHALGVVREGRGLDATYLGYSADLSGLMSMLGEADVATFGPLPTDTIAAISFNLLAGDEQRQQYAALDPLLRGKSFVNDVLPKLDTPTLMFMAAVNGADVDPAVGIDVPVVGLAVKMADDSVAADLKTMLDGATMLANFGVAEFNAGPIPMRRETYNGAAYDVAELGRPIAKGIDFPELAPVQIVYGQVGDYYMVCTQEQYFKRCVDAQAAGRGVRIPIEGAAHRLAQTPVLAMTARPDGFAASMRTWIKRLEQQGLPEVFGDQDTGPVDSEMLYDIAGMLQQYSKMKFQIWQGDDGLVVGRAQLNAPQ